MADADNLREVPASEILAKIEKGEPVEYDHVRVKGDLKVSKLNLPKENNKFLVGSPIKITNSIIFGEIDFSNTTLREAVAFEDTEFIVFAKFIESQFNEKCSVRLGGLLR
jgi:hypothetical protein